MTDVLVCLDGTDSCPTTLAAGQRLAELLGSRSVRALHVYETDERVRNVVQLVGGPIQLHPGPPSRAILREAMGESVSAVVIGSRANAAAGPFGEVAGSLITVAPKPVLVIPRTYGGPMGFQRVLVPLDRSRSTSRGAEELVKRLKESGALVVALHVFDADSVPQFWDRPEYEGEHWGAQFLEHHGVSRDADLRLTSAAASAPEVLATAKKEQSELILLAWGQVLAPGRAEIVRQVLAEAPVPVLLVPSKE